MNGGCGYACGLCDRNMRTLDGNKSGQQRELEVDHYEPNVKVTHAHARVLHTYSVCVCVSFSVVFLVLIVSRLKATDNGML